MTEISPIVFHDLDLDKIKERAGRICIVMTPDGKMGPAARRVNRLTHGKLTRVAQEKPFLALKEGEGLTMHYPSGMAAESLLIVKLSRNPSFENARLAGGTIAKFRTPTALTVLTASQTKLAEVAFGLTLRSYDFIAHKTEDHIPLGTVTISCTKPDEKAAKYAPLAAVAEGVFFTRDLVNEPANILTTTEFANRLIAMKDLGLKVSVLEETDMEKLGMGSLLGVGQGSVMPSKLVVMEWNGGGDEAPFAFVGKGVTFDTGGISIKPAGGMEEMTMDMGGAGTVAGVMRALARRKAKANVVGLVGLVENMPDGNAQRPGDVVKSMKGDTIEVINTDAEGRLVLADVLWYAQEKFNPTGVINLATLTGAVIIALGHEHTGVFSNNDSLCNDFLKAAAVEGEGAWRLPLAPAYDKLLKSRIADMKNIGGRAAGSITAAQFLQRFIKEDQPWIHLDIAGTALLSSDSDLAPKGATGWGVRALDRLIRDKYEPK